MIDEEDYLNGPAIKGGVAADAIGLEKLYGFNYFIISRNTKVSSKITDNKNFNIQSAVFSASKFIDNKYGFKRNKLNKNNKNIADDYKRKINPDVHSKNHIILANPCLTWTVEKNNIPQYANLHYIWNGFPKNILNIPVNLTIRAIYEIAPLAGLTAPMIKFIHSICKVKYCVDLYNV